MHMDNPATWELVWVHVVFNWVTARVVCAEDGVRLLDDKRVAKEAARIGIGTAPCTSRNAVNELVGFLENTPVGSVLRQGRI